MKGAEFTSRRVIGVYLVATGLFTLAASLIWGVNTLFLMGPGGLTIFEVMLVNTAFVIGQAVFEVPTGVVADTIGRKMCYALGIATLLVSTLLYVLTPVLGWGIPGFFLASVLLGLGFTFQTGSVEAWLVDALDATGWDQPKDRVFALGAQVLNVATLVGAVLGGVLGQIDLKLPYVARSASLGFALVVVIVFMREVGFQPRPLRLRDFGTETRAIFRAGVQYGWRNRVVRPLLWVSLTGGTFYIFGFYAWQRYMLDLLGQELVWMAGLVMALLSVMMILGNASVRWIAGSGESRRQPARILSIGAAASAALTIGIGSISFIFPEPGWTPFILATTMWLLFGFVFGVTGPVAQSFINDHIPSAQRATVLSVQAFFLDVGGGIGQPTLGWISQQASIGLAFLIGGGAVAITVPFYESAGRAARDEALAASEKSVA
ncbi:MAG: MFS transporter [Coriobacteriales bacterium]|nr:MFS transporter [Coriobacteriales bacterium]